MSRKQIYAFGIGVASLFVSGVALAATLYSWSQVVNANLAIDANNSTYAVSNAASLAYCPDGFSFLGNRCMHPETGTVFQGNEVLGFGGLGCGADVSFRQHAGAGQNIPPSTHIYLRPKLWNVAQQRFIWASSWIHLGTITAEPSPTTTLFSRGWTNVAGEVQVLLGRAYTPASSRELRWNEVSATLTS